MRRFLVNLLLLSLLSLTTNVEATNTSASCNSGGLCLRTWTYPKPDKNSSTTRCECQSSRRGFLRGAECSDIDLSDGPHVIIDIEFCMTFDENTNITYLGKCPYNHIHNRESQNHVLPQFAYELNQFMCNHSQEMSHICGQQRREGLLCGKCESGLGPAPLLYTHQCVKCHWYGWLLYLAFAFIPAMVFCLIIILLRINFLSPPINALVLLCHVLISYANLTPCRLIYRARENHMHALILSVLTIYGVFNMDFFSYVLPPFCISDRMSTLQVVALDYAVALYPLIFTAVIYLLIEVHDRGFRPLVIIWSPFHRCLVSFRRSWNVKGSIINAFASLYVLSFTKVASTTVSLLLTAHLTDICDTVYWSRLYYDASCGLFQKCHLPYGILSLIMLLLFILLPTLYFLLYPYRHRIMSSCGNWCQNSLKFTLFLEIAKIFHQSFKDGTNGTSDRRWFAGVYLALRVIIISAVLWRTERQIQIIGSVSGLFLVAVFQPHVTCSHNCIDALLFGGLAVIFVSITAAHMKHITQMLIFLIPLIIIIIVLCWRFKAKAANIFVMLHRQVNKCLSNCKFYCCACEAGEGDDQRPLLDEPQSTNISHTVVNIQTYGAAY